MKEVKHANAKIFDRTMWRFALVGIVNTVFGTCIMFMFYNVFHFSYWISSASNYVFGSILSYFLNKYFTFGNRGRIRESLFRFTVNIVLCYMIAYGAARPAMRYILSEAGQSVQDNVSMLIGMCIFVILNYCGQRFFVFKQVRTRSDG